MHFFFFFVSLSIRMTVENDNNSVNRGHQKSYYVESTAINNVEFTDTRQAQVQ